MALLPLCKTPETLTTPAAWLEHKIFTLASAIQLHCLAVGCALCRCCCCCYCCVYGNVLMCCVNLQLFIMDNISNRNSSSNSIGNSSRQAGDQQTRPMSGRCALFKSSCCIRRACQSALRGAKRMKLSCSCSYRGAPVRKRMQDFCGTKFVAATMLIRKV